MTTITRSEGAEWSRAARLGSGRAKVAFVAALLILSGFLADGIYQHVNAGVGHPRRATAPTAPPADRLLIGTYANPSVTVSGDQVRVETPSFSALAVVTGPLVAGPEGALVQPQAVTATWTVNISEVMGALPLAAADFDSIDHQGTEFKLQPPAGTTMPTSVSTGGHVSFQLRAVVPIGEDLFRWAPNGNNIVAKWDNQVEND